MKTIGLKFRIRRLTVHVLCLYNTRDMKIRRSVYKIAVKGKIQNQEVRSCTSTP